MSIVPLKLNGLPEDPYLGISTLLFSLFWLLYGLGLGDFYPGSGSLGRVSRRTFFLPHSIKALKKFVFWDPLLKLSPSDWGICPDIGGFIPGLFEPIQSGGSPRDGISRPFYDFCPLLRVNGPRESRL